MSKTTILTRAALQAVIAAFENAYPTLLEQYRTESIDELARTCLRSPGFFGKLLGCKTITRADLATTLDRLEPGSYQFCVNERALQRVRQSLFLLAAQLKVDILNHPVQSSNCYKITDTTLFYLSIWGILDAALPPKGPAHEHKH